MLVSLTCFYFKKTFWQFLIRDGMFRCANLGDLTLHRIKNAPYTGLVATLLTQGGDDDVCSGLGASTADSHRRGAGCLRPLDRIQRLPQEVTLRLRSSWRLRATGGAIFLPFSVILKSIDLLICSRVCSLNCRIFLPDVVGWANLLGYDETRYNTGQSKTGSACFVTIFA